MSKPGFNRLLMLGWCLLALTTVLPVVTTTIHGQTLTGYDDIISGEYDTVANQLVWGQEANNLIGTSALYGMGFYGASTMIANVEGGLVWDGHDVFETRRDGIPVSLGPGITFTVSPSTLNDNASIPYDPQNAPGAGQYSGHATAVAAMMTGVGLDGNGNLTVLGTGIAPLAGIQSGAIATSWNEDGSFEITKQSFLVPYLQYFTGGTLGASGRADVINSSWGYTDPSGRTQDGGTSFTGILDGLAHDNPTVAFVAAAGNDGPGAAPGGPASGFNGISVGALDYDANHNYTLPAGFTSGAPADFYNPATGQTISGVRAAVDLAAPGTGMILAAYDPDNPSATDLYYVNAAGSSFAAPMVSGGIALLKDMAKNTMPDNASAQDTRVIKAVLMAGATKTTGWNNGQHVNGSGVIETTQSLDYQVGAGLVNLAQSAVVYQNPVTGSRTGLGLNGWDMAQLGNGDSMNYTLALSGSDIELTIALTWFSNTIYDAANETYQDISLSNFNLSVWLMDGDTFATMLAESDSLYNNTELLSLDLAGGLTYGFKVSFDGMVYDINGDLGGQTDTYAVAWSAQAIPEPSAWCYLIAGALLLALFQSRVRRVKA
ncbi:MAG: S8 family serine peptidase [Verrucomicrobiales bacterium]|jgi:hypothetical protein|nr:S8 family serine peptidase [Verrucomicrobiales bacterium]